MVEITDAKCCFVLSLAMESKSECALLYGVICRGSGFLKLVCSTVEDRM